MASPAPDHAKIMGSGFVADLDLKYTELSPAERKALLKKLVEDRIDAICFSAYTGTQNPHLRSTLSPEQVRERLEIITPYTRWIRTFSCTEGNEHAARIGHELGLRTLVGAWLGDELDRNEEELAAVIAVARAGHADRVAIGNEVLYRGDLSADQIIAYIERFRQAVPDVPVGYVDSYYLFPENPALVAACDFLPINCYPYWEKSPLERSPAYVGEMVRRVEAVAGGKPVLIAETGWPTAGPAEGDAVPSFNNMVLYALNLIPWAHEQGIPLFWFSAFDEAWKAGSEGDAGAFWGLWDADGRFKLDA